MGTLLREGGERTQWRCGRGFSFAFEGACTEVDMARDSWIRYLTWLQGWDRGMASGESGS